MKESEPNVLQARGHRRRAYHLVLGLFEVRLKRVDLASDCRTQQAEAGGDGGIGQDGCFQLVLDLPENALGEVFDGSFLHLVDVDIVFFEMITDDFLDLFDEIHFILL